MEINKFNELIGNTSIVSLIKKGTKSRSFPQLSLMSGIHGTGKSSSAKIVAMSLTCENPRDEEACLECDTCRKNIQAFRPGNTGVSPRIEKLNMALIANDKTMKDFLHSTFQIVRSDGIYVKILEEFHRLSEEDQMLMLEETAKIPQGLYLILTTTREEVIIKELRSRCLSFSFGRLNKGETMVLVDRVNRNLKLKAEDYTLIYQKTHGIPRDIVLLVDFLSKVNPTPEEIDALLGNIGKEVFIDLFDNIADFRMYIESVNNLVMAYPLDLVLSKLGNFIVQVVFAIEGEIYEYLPKKVIEGLPFKELETLYKIMRLAEATQANEHSMKVMFLKMRRIVAPTMTIQDQKIAAEITSSVKGIAPDSAGAIPLSKFNKN